MKVKYGVDDGYVLGGRSWTVQVDDEDLEDLSEEQQEDVIDEYIREDYFQRISFYTISKSKE